MSDSKDQSNDRLELGQSMVQTLKGSGLEELTSDLGEVALDALLNDGVLKDVPILGTVMGVWRLGAAIRDHSFVNKLVEFLRALKDVPMEKRKEMVERLEADPTTFGEQVGQQIILLLDRLDHVRKPAMMGRAFRAFCNGQIDLDTLNRLNFAIDRILIGDLERLATFTHQPNGVPGFIQQSFINAGLAHIPGAMGTTQIRANKPLCEAFMRYVLEAA